MRRLASTVVRSGGCRLASMRRRPFNSTQHFSFFETQAGEMPRGQLLDQEREATVEASAF